MRVSAGLRRKGHDCGYAETGNWGLFGDRLVFKISTCSNAETCPDYRIRVLSAVTDSSAHIYDAGYFRLGSAGKLDSSGLSMI